MKLVLGAFYCTNCCCCCCCSSCRGRLFAEQTSVPILIHNKTRPGSQALITKQIKISYFLLLLFVFLNFFLPILYYTTTPTTMSSCELIIVRVSNSRKESHLKESRHLLQRSFSTAACKTSQYLTFVFPFSYKALVFSLAASFNHPSSLYLGLF